MEINSNRRFPDSQLNLMLTIIRIYKINPTKNYISKCLLVVPSKRYENLQKTGPSTWNKPWDMTWTILIGSGSWIFVSWLCDMLMTFMTKHPPYNWVVFPSPLRKIQQNVTKVEWKPPLGQVSFPGHPVAVGDIVNHGSRRRVSPKSGGFEKKIVEDTEKSTLGKRATFVF